ncbi:Hypothetical predicted protein [Xyrichtys novacula]|uniref:Uncharacterized protein n=1 Tax=Xyrichtys novacula TaxID=13765 RepID=A0AAV1GQ32_XYRNO|nr:Hypothetical predicted protein [Xyrichtys novacula]
MLEKFPLNKMSGFTLQSRNICPGSALLLDLTSGSFPISILTTPCCHKDCVSHLQIHWDCSSEAPAVSLPVKGILNVGLVDTDTFPGSVCLLCTVLVLLVLPTVA